MTKTHTGLRSSNWRWIAALWCAGGLFDASQAVLFMHALGKHALLPMFGTELASWLPWALATPLVTSLARRHAINRGATGQTAVVHLAAFVTISAVAQAWFAVLQMLFNPWEYPLRPTFMDAWHTSLPYQVLAFLSVYVLILTMTFVLDARESMARQMTETARLNEELSRAQLAALRRQMEPHFRFNTLNSIAGLVRDHRNTASRRPTA